MKRKTKKFPQKSLLLAALVLLCLFSILFLFSHWKNTIISSSSILSGSNSSLTNYSSPLCQTKNCVYAPILMYHHIAKKVPQESYYVSPEILDQQFSWLSANGYHVISLADFYTAISGKKNLPAKPVVITFDDGDQDNFTTAFPLLQKYNYNATFFIRTAVIGTAGYMDWAQLKSLSGAGMLVESHTVTHPDLTKIDSTKLDAELTTSRQSLENGLGKEVQFLAYPGGANNTTVEAAAKKAGYLLAVTTSHKVYHTLYEDLFVEPRIHIDDEMPSFINWIQGIGL